MLEERNMVEKEIGHTHTDVPLPFSSETSAKEQALECHRLHDELRVEHVILSLL